MRILHVDEKVEMLHLSFLFTKMQFNIIEIYFALTDSILPHYITPLLFETVSPH